jgi:hypothetical protein
VGNNIAFQPMGKTHKANATTTSQVITVTADSPCNQLLVSSHESSQGGQPVYFRVSNQSNVTVVVPNNTTSQYCLVAVPGATHSFTIPYQFSNTTNMYIAFITETTTAECYFTPGEGI